MKKVLLIILILTQLTLTGCWDMREINELSLVMAVAVDKADNSNDFILTVQIANPLVTGENQTTNGSSTDPYIVISARGKTLFDATRELSRISSKRIMWAHNYIIIVGESLAKDDIMPVIDYFTHNPELRMKTPIVVSTGNAMDYLSLKSSQEEIPGVALSEIYKSGTLTGEFIQTDLLSFSRAFYGEYTQPVMSMISFKKGKILPSDNQSADLDDEIEFGGAAVFNKDKMVGELTPEEARGVSWVFNDTNLVLVTVPEPTDPSKFVSVETKDVNTKIKTEINNGKPSVMIDVSGRGKIVEEDGTTDLSINAYKIQLQRLIDKQIVKDIHMCLTQVQKNYGCDILGFAQNIHAQHDNVWDSQIKKNWKKIYPEVPVTINVDINIYSNTLYQEPIKDINKD